VSWEQALVRVADELKRIKEKHGADSLAILGSSKCTNEENYLLQRLARAVLGTNNIDNGSRLYDAPNRFGLGSSIGFPGTTGLLDELERSEAILVIGANPTTSAPAVGYAIKRAAKYKGAKLLLVDPRQTKLAAFANLWLRPKVGTDVALLNGLAKVIIDERLFDEEFVGRRTRNFDELTRSLRKYTPEHVENITGIAAHDVQSAARLFANSERASIVYGEGITQRVTGTDSVMTLANLAMLTGNIGRGRGGIFVLQRENNAQGASDMGSLPGFLPGYQDIHDVEARKKFEERWGVHLPTTTGLTALEMIEQAAAGELKGMLVVGENPVTSFPHPSLVRKALTSLELLVVTDMFLTETAKLATVVLPAASFAEKEGTFTNFEGRVQRIRKAIEHVGNSLADWEIIVQLAHRIGHPMAYSSPRQVMDEIQELVPLYQRLAYADFEAEDLAWADLEGSHLGARRLYKGLFPSGFGRFSPVEYVPPGLSGDEYPLTLMVGSTLPHFGSGTRSSRSPRLKKFSPQAWVEVSHHDAKHFNVSDGDSARLISPLSNVTAKVRVTDTLPAGMLFMPMSFPESPVNELFGIVLDPRSKTPSLKSCAVRLERMNTDV
jgi:formate dehydrogenase alpha subunit